MFLQSAGGFGFHLIYFIFERICGHLFHENLRRRLLSDSIVMQPRQQIGGSRRDRIGGNSVIFLLQTGSLRYEESRQPVS